MSKKTTGGVPPKSSIEYVLEKAGTDRILRVGQLLFGPRECSRPILYSGDLPEDYPSTLKEAEPALEKFLYASNSRVLRKNFDYNNKGRNIDLIEMRLICYVAYAHLLSRKGCADLYTAIEAVLQGDTRPAKMLDARISCGGLCAKGVLRHDGDILGDNNLFLGDTLLKHMAGGGNSPLAAFDPAAFQRLQSPKRQPKGKQDEWHKYGNASRKAAPVQAQDTDAAQLQLQSCGELFDAISRRVIGIDETVRSVSARMGLHLLRAGLLRQDRDPGTPNESLLFLGPSGSGKTYLAETACDVAGLPFGSVSATDITCEGYVGLSVEDALQPLIDAAGGNPEEGRFGICFVDEWDKKATNGVGASGQLDVSGAAVQQAFLRIMEGAVTQVGGRRRSQDPRIPFNSRGTMFAFAGAFVGLEEILGKRRGDKPSLGFGPGKTPSQFKSSSLYEALVDYGIIPEFLNRLTGIVCLPEPTREQLETIAIAPTGVIAAYGSLLSCVGVTLAVSPRAVRLMADYALETRTFARGLKSIFSKLMEELMFDPRPGEFSVDAAKIRRCIEAIEGAQAA